MQDIMPLFLLFWQQYKTLCHCSCYSGSNAGHYAIVPAILAAMQDIMTLFLLFWQQLAMQDIMPLFLLFWQQYKTLCQCFLYCGSNAGHCANVSCIVAAMQDIMPLFLLFLQQLAMQDIMPLFLLLCY